MFGLTFNLSGGIVAVANKGSPLEISTSYFAKS